MATRAMDGTTGSRYLAILVRSPPAVGGEKAPAGRIERVTGRWTSCLVTWVDPRDRRWMTSGVGPKTPLAADCSRRTARTGATRRTDGPRGRGSKTRLRIGDGQHLQDLGGARRDVGGHLRRRAVGTDLLRPGVEGDGLGPAGGGWRGVDGELLPFVGADAMFTPLEPSRFSAPQLTPESGSPEPALPRPGPSPGKDRFGPYENVIGSLAGPGVGARRDLDPDLEAVRGRVAEVLDGVPVDDEPGEAAAAQRGDADRAGRGPG